jgi:hypothetical protein
VISRITVCNFFKRLASVLPVIEFLVLLGFELQLLSFGGLCPMAKGFQFSRDKTFVVHLLEIPNIVVMMSH